jgi:hypothetical protein
MIRDAQLKISSELVAGNLVHFLHLYYAVKVYAILKIGLSSSTCQTKDPTRVPIVKQVPNFLALVT